MTCAAPICRSAETSRARGAANHGASVHVHLRYGGLKEPNTGLAALEEGIAAAAETGASLHVVHITSMGLRDTPDLIAMVKDRPGHDRRYAIDATKIERELGWQPKESFESGLRKTVDWYLGAK